jgi:hypothetical protein
LNYRVPAAASTCAAPVSALALAAAGAALFFPAGSAGALATALQEQAAGCWRSSPCEAAEIQIPSNIGAP